MKNYILLTLMILLSLGTQAFTDPVNKSSNCRLDSTSGNFVDNDRDRILVDLINQNWVISEITTDQGYTKSFNFDEIGTVTVTTMYEDNSAADEVKTMIWQLSVVDNQSILILTNINTDTYTSYAIDETCEGLALTNLLLNKQLELIVQ